MSANASDRDARGGETPGPANVPTLHLTDVASRDDQQKLLLHFEQTLTAVIEWDLEFRVTRWNFAAQQLFGHSPEEALGRHASFIVPNALLPLVNEVWQGLLSQAGGLSSTNENVRKDGQTIVCEWYNTPIINADGVCTAVVSLIQDITERSRTESALLSARRLLERTGELGKIGGWEMDLLSMKLSWTRETFRITEIDPPIEPPLAEGINLFAPEARPTIAAAVESLIEHGTPYDLVLPLITAKGQRRVVQTQGFPEIRQGKVVRIYGTFQDITARLAEEAQALADAQRFDHLVNSINGIVWEADAVPFAFTTVSRSAERLLGYAVPEWMRPGFWERHTHPADRADAEQSRADAIARGEDYDRAYRFVAADGRIVWLRDIVRIVSDVGQPRRLRGLTVEITEQKRAELERESLEAQLRESQKMEAVGTLAGGIAHDFNNALTTILGNTRLALDDAAHDAPVLESLREIDRAATHARDLVRQILSFSRRQATERRRLPLGVIVERAALLLRASFSSRFTVALHGTDAGPVVMADATQLEQVIINLATNAMQAIPEGSGRIDIRVDSVILDEALAATSPRLRALYPGRPVPMARLSVRDDGPGMDATTLARIFEPFYTTKPVGEGTGLGLAVVHGIVQGHSGAMVVESTLGEGSTFSFFLAAESAPPLDGGDTSAPSASAASTGLVGGQRILFLDDEAAIVSLGVRLLERRGYRASGFTSQHEALAMLRRDPSAFDLVLTDYNMPGMSGLDVASEILAIRADLPVAITTGFADELLRTRAAAASVREIVPKPLSVDEFYATVERLLRTGSSALAL